MSLLGTKEFSNFHVISSFHSWGLVSYSRVQLQSYTVEGWGEMSLQVSSISSNFIMHLYAMTGMRLISLCGSLNITIIDDKTTVLNIISFLLSFYFAVCWFCVV